MTFATESEARQFARARIEEGLVVFAGTINPHLPRQLIPTEQIVQWIMLEYADFHHGEVKDEM